MGYETLFEGEFFVHPPLATNHLNYLVAFEAARHMKRDAIITVRKEDPLREAVGLPIGVEGGYYVADESSDDVRDANHPPSGQPGLWCQWIPTEDGRAIEHDGGEKFYNYVEWIEYLIKHFLAPWGYLLNGSVEWNGEERKDFGTIRIIDNEITILDE